MTYPRLLLPLALACACGAVRADPGDLDLRFSGDGVAFIDAGGLGEIVHAMVPDADNAVFATGALYEVDVTGLQGKGGASGYDLSVVRLRGDGSLDIDWGAGGIAQIDFGGDD